MTHGLIVRRLAKYEISADMLRTSRIHLALREMNAADAWKNDESRYQSDILLLKWETRFGSLRKLTINIWADGGRMANVAKLRESASESVPKGLFKASWSVLRSAENANTLALKTGDLDFAVGRYVTRTRKAYITLRQTFKSIDVLTWIVGGSSPPLLAETE